MKEQTKMSNFFFKHFLSKRYNKRNYVYIYLWHILDSSFVFCYLVFYGLLTAVTVIRYTYLHFFTGICCLHTTRCSLPNNFQHEFNRNFNNNFVYIYMYIHTSLHVSFSQLLICILLLFKFQKTLKT